MSGHIHEKSFVVAETRRKWSRAEKEAMIAETKLPGASVSSVARKHGVASSLLFRWRRGVGLGGKEAQKAKVAFVPVALPAPSAGYSAATVMNGGLIEIELAHGRPSGSMDRSTLGRSSG
jgi:transposase